MYMLVHLHKHTHETLPMRGWDDWFVATPWWWVASDWVAWQTRSVRSSRQIKQGHENRLLGPTCWVGYVYMHHIVGGMINEVSTVECWVGCVYMHYRDWVAWQTRSVQLHVGSDMSICSNLEIWIIEKQVDNVWIVELRNEFELCCELC